MSDLKAKFEQLEKTFGGAETASESDISSFQLKEKPAERISEAPSKQQESVIVEEVVVWRTGKKEEKESAVKRQVTKRKTNVIDMFAQKLQGLFPIADVKASYKVTKVNEKLPVFLGFCSDLIDKKSSILNIHGTNSLKLQVFNEGAALKIGILWEVPLDKLEARYHVLKALYQLKSRIEDRKTDFHIRHDQKRLDLSEMVGFEIVFKTYSTLQGALNERNA